MSEAPVEVWLRPGPTWDSYSTTVFPDQPDAVRYVRADLYEALVARLAGVPSANRHYRTEPFQPP